MIYSELSPDKPLSLLSKCGIFLLLDLVHVVGVIRPAAIAIVDLASIYFHYYLMS